MVLWMASQRMLSLPWWCLNDPNPNPPHLTQCGPPVERVALGADASGVIVRKPV